jgi:hypothetical protein
MDGYEMLVAGIDLRTWHFNARLSASVVVYLC